MPAPPCAWPRRSCRSRPGSRPASRRSVRHDEDRCTPRPHRRGTPRQGQGARRSGLPPPPAEGDGPARIADPAADHAARGRPHQDDHSSEGAGVMPAQEVIGKVVSDKMQKSVVVAVERKVRHGVYDKMQRRTTRFMAHDEAGTVKAGDTVAIVESRPLSRSKRWVVVRVVEKAQEI